MHSFATADFAIIHYNASVQATLTINNTVLSTPIVMITDCCYNLGCRITYSDTRRLPLLFSDDKSFDVLNTLSFAVSIVE